MKLAKRILATVLVALMLVTSAPLTGLDGMLTQKAEAASMKQTISSMSVGDTVTYGSYPQTDVTSSMGSTLTAAAPSTGSWKSYNYYIDGTQSDYMKYYDLSYNGTRYRGVYFSKYRPYYWDTTSTANQSENGYKTGNVYWFRYDPLTWRILDPKTGYVICENIIDSQAFNDEYYREGTDAYGRTAHYNDKTYTHLANNWEYSTIRKWLNETFFTTAFSSSERSQIPCTKHTTPAFDTSYSAYDVGETGDYIFLPTYQDMLNTSYGFSSSSSDLDINRKAHSSDYAKSQGVEVSTTLTDKDGKYASDYRLRSAGDYSYITAEVSDYGSVQCDWGTRDTDYGIRPALCFNPSSVGAYGSGETTVYQIKSIKLSSTALVYNGKVRTPSVIVKDSKGNTLKKDTDYTVKYSSGRKNPGTYKVTVTFKGNYSGKKTLSFKINPKATAFTSLTPGKGKATLKWKAVSGVTGYEVWYYSTAKGKYVKDGVTTRTSYSFTGLASGKTYKLKVRTYKTVSGTKYYSAFSTVKTVKAK